MVGKKVIQEKKQKTTETGSVGKGKQAEVPKTDAKTAQQPAGASPGPQQAAPAQSGASAQTPPDPAKTAADLEQRRIEVARLNALLIQRSQEIDALRASMNRLQMDFDSYRSRANKDKEDFAHNRMGQVLGNFMEVADNIDAAISTTDPKKVDGERLYKGFVILSSMFAEAMKKAGIAEVPAINQPFNTDMHEAVGRVTRDDVPEGTIVGVEKKGYSYGGRILRPARVMVTVKKT